jgi:hypothetical protein
MKKTGTIGLLSIIPGLGHFILGDVRMGLVFLIIIILFGLFTIFSPSETVFVISLTLGLIAWGYQWVHAVTTAQRQARTKANLALPVREVTASRLSPFASSADKQVHKARQTVLQLLQPGEQLKFVVTAARGTSSLASALLDLVIDGAGSGGETGVVYLAVTDKDFILVDTDLLGKPSELKRYPIDQVSLIGFREGKLADQVVIHIGETLPLGVSVACVLRRETRQIVEILSGGSMDSVQPEITSVAERPGEIVRKPSFIKLFLSGTGAALAGNAVGVLLGGVLIALLMSPNDFEGYVTFVAILCGIAGLPVSLAFGALSAWLGPILARSKPKRTSLAVVLLGFALGIAVWLVINSLFLFSGWTTS